MSWWMRGLVAVTMLAIVIVFWALGAGSRTDGPTSTTLGAATTTTAGPSGTVNTTDPFPATTLATVPVVAGQPGTFLVSDFGAAADGKNDDSPAFQAAVDAAAGEGGVVIVPSVGGRRAYVLNQTVAVPSGVSIIGASAGSGLDVGGPYPWPDTVINGAKILARPSPVEQPLFRLAAGTTVRGLWITYDQQPLPSDDELSDLDGDYQYLDFAEARTFFIDEHVAPTGPTFYVESGDQVTIENIVADRYTSFLYMKEGGPLTVDSVALHGYGTGFTIENSDAVNVFTNIDFSPTVGPFVPGTGTGAQEWTWAFGAIASQPNNVGFHFGRADGFVLDNVAFSAGNTAVRLGASFDFPIIDPLTQMFFTSASGQGPWGQIDGLRIEEAAVGVHMVWPSPVAVQLSNISMIPGIDDGAEFDAVSGSGDLGGVGRQAFVLVEASYRADNNGTPPQVPAILASNVALAGSTTGGLFGDAAGNIDEVNGRVFLVNGDLGMEINGFSLGLPFAESLMIAAGDDADEVSIRIRGVLAAGLPEADKLVEADGVSVLAGDIVVIQPPAPPPAPPTTVPPDTTTPPSTTAPPTTTPPSTTVP